MSGISQSVLLQALGWATLNSFWQAGLLWCAFALARRCRPMLPSTQYFFTVLALGISLACFAGSFWFYMLPQNQSSFVLHFLENGKTWFPLILTSASVAYLLLLFFPLVRLLRNWSFLRSLRNTGLHKAGVSHRLYVQRLSCHLNIKMPVNVYLSALIHSPVTIGFLKPLILLPVASFNQLSTQQAEAILLHELAHIRRHDYLVNIFISCIHTLLYFNPFVRLLVRAAESAREECCDAIVLQFGYDRMAYASALLQLEKSAAPVPVLALGATGRSQLISRIEAIVGLPRIKPVLRIQHFTGLIASVLCVFALHSLFISGKKIPPPDNLHVFTQFANPFNLVYEAEKPPAEQEEAAAQVATIAIDAVQAPEEPAAPPEPPLAEPVTADVIQVAHIEHPALALDVEAQKQVAATINTTRKVLSTLEWQQIEKSIGDGLTPEEKEMARQEYLSEIEQINWKNLADNMARQYAQSDWQRLNAYLQQAACELKADSITKAFSLALKQIEASQKAQEQLALPDLSKHELMRVKAEIRKVRDSLINVKERPIIKL